HVLRLSRAAAPCVLPPFLTRRSSDLFVPRANAESVLVAPTWISMRPGRPIELLPAALVHELDPVKSRLVSIRNEWIVIDDMQGADRKSTRLNSSHGSISYAFICLKKK